MYLNPTYNNRLGQYLRLIMHRLVLYIQLHYKQHCYHALWAFHPHFCFLLGVNLELDPKSAELDPCLGGEAGGEPPSEYEGGDQQCGDDHDCCRA